MLVAVEASVPQPDGVGIGVEVAIAEHLAVGWRHLPKRRRERPDQGLPMHNCSVLVASGEREGEVGAEGRRAGGEGYDDYLSGEEGVGRGGQVTMEKMGVERGREVERKGVGRARGGRGGQGCGNNGAEGGTRRLR